MFESLSLTSRFIPARPHGNGNATSPNKGYSWIRPSVRRELYGCYTKIRDGVIGQPIIIRSQGAEKLDKTGFFIEYARHSGGIFVDTVIHDIDLTLSIPGENVKPIVLWATGILFHHHEMKDVNDIDNAVGVVEFWGGRVAHYYHSRTMSQGYV